MSLSYNFQLISRTGPRKTHLLVLKTNPRIPSGYESSLYDTQSKFANPRMQPFASGFIDGWVIYRKEFKLYAQGLGRYGTLTLENFLESGQNSGIFRDYHLQNNVFDAVFTGRRMG
jgi:hypothetical protein